MADVDEAKRLVLVRDRKDPRQKAGNDQWVPLLGEAWMVLKRQPQVGGEARIFPIGASTVSKYFTEACMKMSIPDLHFHDLRHEGTSQLFEEGYEIQQVALVTGHKDWRHLRRYTNLKPEDRHRAIGRPAPSTKRSRCGPEESGPSSWDQCSAGRGLAIARPEAAGARWAQVSTILGRVDVAPNAAPWVPHRKGATTEENGADECGLR